MSSSGVSKARNAFMFRVKQSKKSSCMVAVLGLLDSEDEGITSIKRFGTIHARTTQLHHFENLRSRTELFFLIPVWLHPAVSLRN